MTTILDLAGVLCQIVGIGTATVGLWRTWREFAPEGDSFFRPVEERVKAVGQWLRATLCGLVRRLLRRPPYRRAEAGVALGGGGALSVRGRGQFRDLPTDLDAGSAIAELDDRTHELRTMISELRERHADDMDRAQRATADLRDELGLVTGRLDKQSRHAAVGGIRLEALGLFFVGAGIVLQGIAQIVGP